MRSQVLVQEKKMKRSKQTIIIRQTNCASKTALINHSILEPIGNYIRSTACQEAACNAAGDAAKSDVDGGRFQSLNKCW